jgi:hypothetical protein
LEVAHATAKWFPRHFRFEPELRGRPAISIAPSQREELSMKYALVIAAVAALATPALADEVGVHVGPVGAGVTVGESHRDYDRYRDRDHATTVIREREPRERTTVIKKQRGDGVETKTIIHDRD